jgi:hypothetical protein
MEKLLHRRDILTWLNPAIENPDIRPEIILESDELEPASPIAKKPRGLVDFFNQTLATTSSMDPISTGKFNKN